MIYEHDCLNVKYFDNLIEIKNIKGLNETFSYNSKYKIDSIKNLSNYFKKLK